MSGSQAVGEKRRPRWRLSISLLVLFFAGLLAITAIDILPRPLHIALLRALPTKARDRFIDYVLADRLGFLRSELDKREMVLLVSETGTQGKPLTSRYDLLIPYAGYYMSKKYGVVTEYPEGERTPEATQAIMMQRDKRLLEKTFAFHAGDLGSIEAICSQLHYNQFPEQFERHCARK